MNPGPHPPLTHHPLIQTLHWLTLVLVMAAFAAIYTAHWGYAGENFWAVVQLHRSLGLAVLAVTIARLMLRCRLQVPALPRELPAIQKLAARGTEALLYGILLAQPLLGLIHTNARGQRVDLFFIGELPPIVGPDKALARLTHDAHETLAAIFLVLIGLHASAALFHHFIRRDDVLNAMLPRRLRRRDAPHLR
jgi:cytochrome b561